MKAKIFVFEAEGFCSRGSVVIIASSFEEAKQYILEEENDNMFDGVIDEGEYSRDEYNLALVFSATLDMEYNGVKVVSNTADVC